MKIQFFFFFFFFWGGWGGHDGCELRSEAFVKIQKKNFFFGGVGLGDVRVNGNWEMKLLGKLKKKYFFFFGGGGQVGGGGGFTVDVN